MYKFLVVPCWSYIYDRNTQKTHMKSNGYIYGKCLSVPFYFFLLVTVTDHDLALFSLLVVVITEVPQDDKKLHILDVP